MPSEKTLVYIAVIAALLAVVCWAWRRAVTRADREDPFTAADNAPAYEIPEDTGWWDAEEPPEPLVRAAKALHDARTQAITDLPAPRTLRSVPEPDTAISGIVINRIIAEADEWHWTLGRWEPPTEAWAHLPHEDWLRELLVAA